MASYSPEAVFASLPAPGPPDARGRPLPPVPPPRKHPRHISPPTPSAPLLKSSAWRNMHRNAVRALRQPRFLSRLLFFADWDDVYALLSTCASARRLWRSRATSDVILSHYLPCYRIALRFRDLSALQPVDFTLHDLHLLCSSFPALPVCTLTIFLQCSHNASPSTSIPCTRLPASPNHIHHLTTTQPLERALDSLPLPAHTLVSSFSYNPSFIAPLSPYPSTRIFLFSPLDSHRLRTVPFASSRSQLHSLTLICMIYSLLMSSLKSLPTPGAQLHVLAPAPPAPYRGPTLRRNPRSRHPSGGSPFLVVLTLHRHRWSHAHSGTTKLLGGAPPPRKVPRTPTSPLPSPLPGPLPIPKVTSLVLLQGPTNAPPLPKFPLRPRSAVAHPNPLAEKLHTAHTCPTLPTISLLRRSGLVLLSSAFSSRAMPSLPMLLQLVRHNSIPGGSGGTSRPETSFATLVIFLQLQRALNLNSIFLLKTALHLETLGYSSTVTSSFLLLHQAHHHSRTLLAFPPPSIIPTSCRPT